MLLLEAFAVSGNSRVKIMTPLSDVWLCGCVVGKTVQDQVLFVQLPDWEESAIFYITCHGEKYTIAYSHPTTSRHYFSIK